MVSEDDTAAIRAAFDKGGEFVAAIELRRRFPGITDNARARECARTIAGWTPDARPAAKTATATQKAHLTKVGCQTATS